MAFFKRELSAVERFESTLRNKHAARQKLADRLSLADTVVGAKRAAAERLAVAGATDAKLGRAETELRAVEERAKALRAELAESDEQIASTERTLADAKAQRDRDLIADPGDPNRFEAECFARRGGQIPGPAFDVGAAIDHRRGNRAAFVDKADHRPAGEGLVGDADRGRPQDSAAGGAAAPEAGAVPASTAVPQRAEGGFFAFRDGRFITGGAARSRLCGRNRGEPRKRGRHNGQRGAQASPAAAI